MKTLINLGVFAMLRKVTISYVFFFYVLLTLHLSITLANDQLDAQIFSTFVTILYMF